MNKSPHAMTSELASKVKKAGHTKEDEVKSRLWKTNANVIKGQVKPDVIDDNNSYSVKGAAVHIQLFLCTVNRSKDIYGSNSPMYKYQKAGFDMKKHKFETGIKRKDLVNNFHKKGNDLVKWLRKKDNFRSVIEKALTDNYDVNKLIVLEEIDVDGFIYDMKDVVNLYVNSNYKVSITKRSKIKVTIGEREVFCLEIRGCKNHCGSMNHCVRTKHFYPFLKHKLNFVVLPPKNKVLS